MKHALVPTVIAGALLLGLTGCMGQPGATATVTVTAQATETAPAIAATNVPNNVSSPETVAQSMFRDIKNKDAEKYLDLFYKSVSAKYRASVTRFAPLADVSKFTEFVVTSVEPGITGNDTDRAARVYFTMKYDGQELQGKLYTTLADPEYAPNKWSLDERSAPFMFLTSADTGTAGYKPFATTFSGNGKQITVGSEDENATREDIYLFPGDYTIHGHINSGGNYTAAEETNTLNAFMRP